MARVTVEDCIDKVDNRFELVLLAGHRARQISQGAQITIPRDNDKNPVVALREIADAAVKPAHLEEDFIGSLQKQIDAEQGDDASDSERVDAPEFDKVTEDEYIRALKASGMTTPQSLPKG